MKKYKTLIKSSSVTPTSQIGSTVTSSSEHTTQTGTYYISHFSLKGTKLCIILILKILATTNHVPHNSHKLKTSKARKRRCMECAGCKREDCGSCINCNDMKKFGGQGKKKQKCMHRICTQMTTTDEGKWFAH